MEEVIRIDKWLWSVRLFKTRTLATEACRSGKVKIREQAVKPSHEIKINEVITVWQAPVLKTVRIIEPLGHRVSAKLVPGFMEDLTPESEYQKLKVAHDSGFEYRDRGTGRPTKRQRREIELLKKYFKE